VRPGRSALLPVLANDSDPDGDVLTATPQDNGGRTPKLSSAALGGWFSSVRSGGVWESEVLAESSF